MQSIRSSQAVKSMRAEEETSTAQLRAWFDRLVQLPRDAREAKLGVAPISEWQRTQLREMLLFDELAGQDGPSQEAALSANALPAVVRERLDEMLEKDRQLLEALSAGAPALLRQLRDEEDEALADSLIGMSVGSFRLESLIGQGGSSAVFRAARGAGTGSQVVALKVMRTGLYSTDAQRRFRREQAILAQLTHPNIATLIEGGVSAAGIPYIAMELVEGLPITRAADAQHLTVEQRLVWFAGLCRTIEAAHRALIVHRDLKPSNVFITKDGLLKVLDFGIAKTVEDEEATRTLAIALTPAYAAPEQYANGPLTTMVDVYALGVLLGELLTGQRLTGKGRASVSVVTDDGVLPAGLPSRSVLARRLRGDLDAILLTALAHEPAMRYPSAAALGDDVERYLAGKPVRAHPPSRWYRTRKFVARHRFAMALTVVLSCAALASASVLLWQDLAIQRAAAKAQLQASRAESMRNFIFEVFTKAEPAKPHDGPITLNEVVEQAILKTEHDRSIDPRARLELLQHLGDVVGAQGKLERSGALLEKLRDQAAQQIAADDPLMLDIEHSVEYNHGLRGDYALARQEIDRLLARIPLDSVELRASVLRDSADIANKLGDDDVALRDIRSAVDISRQAGNINMLRDSLEDLGIILGASNDDPAAIGVFTEVLELMKRRYGEESDRVADVLADLSRSYRRSGQLELAEKNARAALAIDRKIYPDAHYKMSNHLNALGQALVARRNLDQALATYVEGAQIAEATLGALHSESASTFQALAYVEIQMENYTSAVPHLRTALDGKTASFGPQGWETAFVRSDYGYALAMNGDRRQGVREMDTAIADLRSLVNPKSHALARAIEKRIRFALDKEGDAATAAGLLGDLAVASHAAQSQTAYWAGRVNCIRGEIALERHAPHQAKSDLEDCAAELNSLTTPEPVMVINQQLLLAAAARQSGDAETADRIEEEVHEHMRSVPYLPSRFRKLERVQ